MTYSEVLAHIHSRRTFSSCASLERISRLMDRLGNPQSSFRCIHVAGTNGKGSTCALVEAALRQAGYRVGLFTSPYLVDFRERIQINRQLISQEQLIACYKTVMEAEAALECEGFEPVNEFELVTALGFTAFAAERVDYAVIEVGLGGRWDATNVLIPEVSCITPISLDHTAVLGDSISKIAREKAGIIKEGRPVVLSVQQEEAKAVLVQAAAAAESPVIMAGTPKLEMYDKDGLRFSYDGESLSVPLLGYFQMENAAAAWEVCKLLGLPRTQVKAAFAQVQWQGRLQYVPGKPDMLIDAGHNPAGIAALCQCLDQLFGDREILAVMAMMRDKDYSRCIPMVAARCQRLIAATVGLPRSLPPDLLAQIAAPLCETDTAVSVPEGIRKVRIASKPGQLVLICGSVYAAGEALKTIS